MRTYTIYATLCLLLTLLSGNTVTYAEQQVYGWQLMSEQERHEHRIKMRSFKTEQERIAYRHEHHKRMQERAKQQGVTLPDEPKAMGKGMQRGPGMGSGGGGGGRNR